MKNILPIPEGSPITIIDVLYYEPYKHQNAYNNDVMMVIYKEGDSDEKKVCKIAKPEIEYYVTKPEYRDFKTPREYIHESKVETRRCAATNIVQDVIKVIKEDKSEIGDKFREIINLCYSTNNRRALGEVHKYPYVQMTDSKPKDYYRIMMGYHYNCDRMHNFRKSFMDIEAHVYKLTDLECRMNKDSVNAITVIFDFDPTGKTDKRSVHTLMVRRYEDYPQQEAFEKNIDKFKKRCHEEFDEIDVVRKKKKTKFKTNAKYNFKFFDTEIEMLEYYWQLMHWASPDTCEIWNIAYDIPKIYNRILANKKNPIDIMSHPEFPKGVRFVEMQIDNRGKIGNADRKTYINMTNKIKHIDQMLLYSAMNKGGKDYGSDALDNVGFIEVGMRKREFTDKRVNVKNAPVLAYEEFILYSIQDVWLQVLIEDMTKHVDSLMTDSNASACSTENINKQTQYLKNLYYLFRLNRGYVSGNNPNIDYVSGVNDEMLEELEAMREYALEKSRNRLDDDDDEDDPEETVSEIDKALESIASTLVDGVHIKHKLQGGLVGDPNLNTANGVEIIPGIKSRHVFNRCMDQDYGSEYPNAEITRNISANTERGRIVIDHKISDRQNVYGNDKYIPGGEFLSDYITGDMVSFGNVWFNLPTTEEAVRLYYKQK